MSKVCIVLYCIVLYCIVLYYIVVLWVPTLIKMFSTIHHQSEQLSIITNYSQYNLFSVYDTIIYCTIMIVSYTKNKFYLFRFRLAYLSEKQVKKDQRNVEDTTSPNRPSEVEKDFAAFIDDDRVDACDKMQEKFGSEEEIDVGIHYPRLACMIFEVRKADSFCWLVSYISHMRDRPLKFLPVISIPFCPAREKPLDGVY